MTEEQVRQLADEGFTIGVHTASHSPLGQAPADVQRHELESCRVGARIVDGQTRRRARVSVRRTDGSTTPQKPWRLPRASASPTGFTTRHDFARRSEPRARAVALRRAGRRHARRNWRTASPTPGRADAELDRCRPQPRISVLLTSYNREDYIAESIESVLAQSMTDFELVICDDHSTDGTVGIIHDYARRDSRIRVIGQRAQPRRLRQSPPGREPGARAVSSSTTTPTIVMYGHCLATMVEPLEAEPRAAFALSGCAAAGRAGRARCC